MSAFEWNKIIASVLTAMIVAMVAGILGEPDRPPDASGAAGLPAARRRGRRHCNGGALAEKAAGPEPIDQYMAKADPAKGQQTAKVCLQCHTFAKGEPNKIGPNLFGVMEENIAAVPNYQFSPALAAHKADKWDPDELNVWLYKPQQFAKGTKMTFAGLPKTQDRADVIAYLESLK